MSRRVSSALGAVLALVAFGAPAVRADAPNVEVTTLQQINQGRATVGLGALVMHAGLRTQARQHSQNMAVVGGLNHNGFAQRLSNATPDPPESNGPIDDGFNLDGACENVALRFDPSETEAQTSAGLFNQWLNSPPHRQCMYDEAAAHNAAGLGVFRDASGQWWATLIPVRDLTPPTGGGPPGPPPPVMHGPFFSSSSPCGKILAAPVMRRPAPIGVSAWDARSRTVTLAPWGLPAYAEFTSTAGNPATATITAAPSVLEWVAGLFVGPLPVLVMAASSSGRGAPCGFGLRAVLL